LKFYKVTTKFKAHDENNEYKTGDKVTIEESRPLSREKRWRIINKIA
jgi:small subunit ribosomal protein S17